MGSFLLSLSTSLSITQDITSSKVSNLAFFLDGSLLFDVVLESSFPITLDLDDERTVNSSLKVDGWPSFPSESESESLFED